jgi:hypothetical protein
MTTSQRIDILIDLIIDGRTIHEAEHEADLVIGNPSDPRTDASPIEVNNHIDAWLVSNNKALAATRKRRRSCILNRIAAAIHYYQHLPF